MLRCKKKEDRIIWCWLILSHCREIVNVGRLSVVSLSNILLSKPLTHLSSILLCSNKLSKFSIPKWAKEKNKCWIYNWSITWTQIKNKNKYKDKKPNNQDYLHDSNIVMSYIISFISIEYKYTYIFYDGK